MRERERERKRKVECGGCVRYNEEGRGERRVRVRSEITKREFRSERKARRRGIMEGEWRV